MNSLEQKKAITLKKKQLFLLVVLLAGMGFIIGNFFLLREDSNVSRQTSATINKDTKEAIKEVEPFGSLSGVSPQDIVLNRCAMCHGVNGQGINALYPALAGQHEDYLKKQLNDFKGRSDKKRQNELMQSIAEVLTDHEMDALSVYFSTQISRKGAAIEDDTMILGRQRWRAGNKSIAIPSCTGCHGPSGYGIPGTFPRLAGQYREYTMAQLVAFRNESRNNDPNEMMHGVTQRMTDKEIRAISNFIEGLR